jgi:hypothetical protein
MDAANVEVDGVAFGPLYVDREVILVAHVAEEIVRDEVAMDIRDHFTSPNTRPSAAHP